MNENREIYFWWAQDSNYEYDVAGAFITRPKPLYVFADKKIQYNQHTNDPEGCTWYAVMTCITNNWDIIRTTADFDYMRKTAPLYWRKAWFGMELSKAGDMVVDYLNRKYPWQWRTKEQIRNYDDKDILKSIIHEWYCVQMWSPINSVYMIEIKDWVVNNPRWKDWTGHSRTFAESGSHIWEEIVENFVGILPYNVIDIKDLDNLLAVKQFFYNSFIYYPTHMPETPIKYPYMSIETAQVYEKKDPVLYKNLSETVRAWVDLAHAGKDVYYNFVNFEGISGVDKMIINLDKYRSGELPT